MIRISKNAVVSVGTIVFGNLEPGQVFVYEMENINDPKFWNMRTQDLTGPRTIVDLSDGSFGHELEDTKVLPVTLTVVSIHEGRPSDG